MNRLLRRLSFAGASFALAAGSVLALCTSQHPTPRIPAGTALRKPAPVRSVASFVRAFADATPSAQELAVLELGRSSEAASLTAGLRAELDSPLATHRRLATLALGRLRPGALLDTLVERALGDPDRRVRLAAALAVRAANDPAAAEPFRGALASPLASRRLYALEALGIAGSTAQVPALRAHLARLRALAGAGGGFQRSNLAVTNQITYVQDFDVEIAQAASIGNPIVAVATEGAVLDVAVAGVGVERVSPATELRAALRALAAIQERAHGKASDAGTAGPCAASGSRPTAVH